ncbi:hypothetical protein BuS5_01032 [Desulfosarcina sp. BuS5]|uniref:TolC family protein n=2 Tax=Desulfosarcina sp. BuS5 TaxID=933262 RepID=UPI002378C0F6|nr:hypothetical protein [Desulfosarcina sp. BuS5]WDN88064.1 hypothetical protein BuS5_01032 [Desulfosarcina sp. BuS5]
MKETNRFPSTHLVTISSFKDLVSYPNDSDLSWHEEDAMVAFLRSQDEVKFLSESVKAATRSVDISMIQYREGLVDYQRVLDSLRFQTHEQNLLTETRGSVALNFIAMFKALGGGWQIREGRDFVPGETLEKMQNRTNWGNLLTPTKLETPPADENKLWWRWPEW